MSTLLLIKSLEQGPEERNRTSYFFCILPFIGIVGGTRCFLLFTQTKKKKKTSEPEEILQVFKDEMKDLPQNRRVW